MIHIRSDLWSDKFGFESGFPGRFAGAFSPERYRMYLRAGLPVFPLAYTAWMFRRDECLAALGNALGLGSVPPGSAAVPETS